MGKDIPHHIMDTDVEIVPQIVKHSSLFFPDGNIILSITHNDEQHLFRCHKSVLAKHSPVFADMFELAQWTDQEEYDGVLSVTLPDAFEDVSALLSLLYDPLKMPYKKHDPNTARTLHGPLKLATKYKMSSLRKRFISILQADWPYEIEDWDDNETEIAKAVGEKLPFPEPARVIRLARECNVPSLLPAAFYHLGRCYDAGLYGESEYNEPEINLLATEDWHCLLRGRDMIRAELAAYLCNFLVERRAIDAKSICSHSPPDRPDSWGCKQSVREWWTATCFQALPKVLFVDPLEELNVLSRKVDSAPSAICKYCRPWMKQYLMDQRHCLWANLRDSFGLNVDKMVDDGLSEI